MRPSSPTEAPSSRPPLAREFTRFLLELAIGVHRYAVYPAHHPSLEPTAEAVLRHLQELFRDRSVVRVGIARDRLLMEGGTTDPKNAVLGDLALGLHRQQISAVSFTRGLTVPELQGILSTLARTDEGSGVPLGLRSVEELPDWTHARIHPLGVERLAPGEGGAWDGARAADLWMGLAAAVLAEEASDAARAADVSELARRLADEASLAERTGTWLAQLAAELRATAGSDVGEVRERTAELLRALDDPTLDRVLQAASGADPAFLRDVNRALPPDVALRLVRAAARTGAGGLSEPMIRILSKLAPPGAAAPGHRTGPTSSPRDLLERILLDWEGASAARTEGIGSLDALARAAPVFRDAVAGVDDPAELSGPWRVVETALEVGATGPTVERALIDLIESDEADGLVGRLHLLQEDAPVAGVMLDFLTGSDRLARLLAHAPIEGDALDILVERAGEAAVEPLLEVLVESESRALRRTVFDLLAGLGEAVGRRAVERLEDPRWYVQRNMLALLRRLPELPRGLDPLWFAAHGDHRIRREAFPLALRDPIGRSHALALGLADQDERLVRMALLELDGQVPDALLATLLYRTLREDRSPGIRALAIRTVRPSDSPKVRDALLEVAAPERSLLGRPRIAGATADVVAAIEVLRERWSGDDEVRAVLERARRSRDGAVRQAAGEAE